MTTHMNVAEMTLRELVDAVASPTPTPGGGTVAALAGALGAALVEMVAGLPRTRTGSDEERAALTHARGISAPARERLLQLASRDADAYAQVMQAFARPKGTEIEKQARTAAIQQALQGATTVPLETLRAVAEVKKAARTAADAGHPNAASDAGVAIALLDAAASGATMNVRINLAGIRDEAFTSQVEEEMRTLLGRND